VKKKDAAINTLEAYLRELEQVEDVKVGNTWKAKTKDTLILYLGENSALVKRLDELFFTKANVINYHNGQSQTIHEYAPEHKDDFKKLVKNSISYLKANGVYVPPKDAGYYRIKQELFWTILIFALPATVLSTLYFANVRYDQGKIDLADKNSALKDSIVQQNKTIDYLRHNSDSALNVLSHMPYQEMNLDRLEFDKVQTNIETAGAVLNLNKASTRE
jgi:hypothetical protein